ncbi:MAG: DUF3455 domain-containing protein [Burkholderiaceae bacterium]
MIRTTSALALAAACCIAPPPACAATPAAASASAVAPAPDGPPGALRPAMDQEPFASFKATGVQIYECAHQPDKTPAYAWRFRAPEATLAEVGGDATARHFAGPSWTAADGSTIVGQVKATLAAPRADSIAWLLLDVKTRQGHGFFERAASVQRLDTVGGMAPTLACGADNEHQEKRIDYTATYVFWRVKGG